MPDAIPHTEELQPDTSNLSVVQVSGTPCIGLTELSASTSRALEPASASADGMIEPDGTDIQARFDAAIAECKAVKQGRGYFPSRTAELIEALVPALRVYRLVKHHPELEDQLRANDLLKDRTRRLGKDKLALLSVYCTMQPASDAPAQKKACSEYTAWLFQAEHEGIASDAFAHWAEERTLKACLAAVRERNRDGTSSDRKHAEAPPPIHLSIRRGAKGVRGSLGGRTFSLSEETLSEILALIPNDQAGATISDNAGAVNA